jgi:hypothetical protein
MQGRGSRSISGRTPPPLRGLLLCFALTACAGEDAAPPQAPPADLSAAALRSATYPSPYVEAGVVRLTAGRFEDAARRVTVYLMPEYAVGDLDADGVPDAAAILATDAGGSGTFLDLAAVLNREGVPECEAILFLGDRIPVERIRIVGDEIQLDVTMHGPADPMCCPSVQATRRFRLEGDTLVEIPADDEGGDDAP